MDNEVKRYKKYKKELKFMLVGSGLWPNYEAHPKLFRNFLTVCSAFANAVMTYGIFMFCVKYHTNITRLTSGMGLVLSFLSLFLKVCTLSLHGKDLQSLNDGLSLCFESDLVEPTTRPHLLAHFPTFLRFFYAFNYSAMLNLIMVVVAPLLMIRHGKYVRMYPQVLPFTYEPGGTVHWILFLFEMLCGFYLWSISCGVDSVFGLYTLHMIGELRLLANRLKSLKSSSNYKKDLKDCIDRHVLLMESRLILERTFGFLSIWLAVTSAIAVCSIIFQVWKEPSTSLFRICRLLFYVFIKLLQAYTYAWFGNVITIESEMCMNSIYDAYWPGSGDKSFMKDVLIVLSQKPFLFQAKSCMMLRLDVFFKIVKTSVSYFCLLQTLEENQL